MKHACFEKDKFWGHCSIANIIDSDNNEIQDQSIFRMNKLKERERRGRRESEREEWEREGEKVGSKEKRTFSFGNFLSSPFLFLSKKTERCYQRTWASALNQRTDGCGVRIPVCLSSQFCLPVLVARWLVSFNFRSHLKWLNSGSTKSILMDDKTRISFTKNSQIEKLTIDKGKIVVVVMHWIILELPLL